MNTLPAATVATLGLGVLPPTLHAMSDDPTSLKEQGQILDIGWTLVNSRDGVVVGWSLNELA